MTYGNTIADGSGTFLHLLVNADGQLVIDEGWTPLLQADENANDSDKSFTVPADTEWDIQNIWIEYASTGTAGNRILMVEIQDDAADVILRITAGAVQAASITRYYVFAPNVSDLTSFRNTSYLTNPLPKLILPAGYVIHIYDSAAVDAAADDMVIQMLLKSRSVP